MGSEVYRRDGSPGHIWARCPQCSETYWLSLAYAIPEGEPQPDTAGFFREAVTAAIVAEHESGHPTNGFMLNGKEVKKL